MASSVSRDRDVNKVLLEATSCVRKVTLNRPRQLNCLTFDMIAELLRTFQEYEQDPQVRLVIVKGKGKAFCAGGDVVRVIQFMLRGDYRDVLDFYRRQLTLDYLVATYKKPVVFIINGAVMGGGAGLSMNAKFRIVTENTVFAMPEASFGHYPDVGASYFLSRLPGHFGEYLGLTGTKINGPEMLACGLATHFVYSKDIESMENALCRAFSSNTSSKNIVHESDVSRIIIEFVHNPVLKEGSGLKSLEFINHCFGKETVEDIISALEKEATRMDDKWITNAIKSMKLASPTSLKITLRSIREGRKQTLRQCLLHEFNISSHIVLRSFNNDFYEGGKAIFLEKGKKFKWEPSKLEQVHDATVMQFFTVAHHDRWGYLEIPDRELKQSKL